MLEFLILKETSKQLFSYELCVFFKKDLFTEHHGTPAIEGIAEAALKWCALKTLF